MTCTQDHKIINCDLGPLTWDPGPTQIRIFVISWTHNSKCVMVYQIESFKSWYKSINGFWSYRNSHPEVFLGKLVLKICSKFTGEHPCWSAKCDFNKVALQLYWSRTSAWVFSCKFAAYFQNTFFHKKTSRGLLL